MSSSSDFLGGCMLSIRTSYRYLRTPRLSYVRNSSYANFRNELGDSIARLKNPTRGGQNLRERYRRLERSARGKDFYAQQVSEYVPSPPPATRRGGEERVTFRGFVIPKKPEAPGSDECCMGGCAVCVYDLYEEALISYEEALVQLREALVSAKIPDHEWPAQIRPDGSGKGRRVDVVLSAFEEFERSLKAKREAESGLK